MRILYVGPLWQGGTCLQRFYAMRDLGHDVRSIDTAQEPMRRKEKQIYYKIKKRFFGPSDLANVNERILKCFGEEYFDILWLDKGLTIKPETLRNIRQMNLKTIIAGYSPDDMMNPNNQTYHFLKGLKYYDVFFTTKSYGVKELRELGCPRVAFVNNAYDPATHRPMEITEEHKVKFGGPVGFIGSWEKERADFIRYLADNGIPARVWGSVWTNKLIPSANLHVESVPLRGDDYARAICAFDINLAFLRKANRDLQTQRSIEIPACGAFMLAERTDEHLSLFTEGKEAEFFSNKAELLDKITYYLEHDDIRKSIAVAGRERCLRDGYSNYDRIKDMLNIIDQIFQQQQN